MFPLSACFAGPCLASSLFCGVDFCFSLIFVFRCWLVLRRFVFAARVYFLACFLLCFAACVLEGSPGCCSIAFVFSYVCISVVFGASIAVFCVTIGVFRSLCIEIFPDVFCAVGRGLVLGLRLASLRLLFRLEAFCFSVRSSFVCLPG